jgi:hypothetical protein
MPRLFIALAAIATTGLSLASVQAATAPTIQPVMIGSAEKPAFNIRMVVSATPLPDEKPGCKSIG